VTSRPPEEPREPSARQPKSVMGSRPASMGRKSFVRELQRAARALLDKRSPQK
jgi:hypothetical protein